MEDFTPVEWIWSPIPAKQTKRLRSRTWMLRKNTYTKIMVRLTRKKLFFVSFFRDTWKRRFRIFSAQWIMSVNICSLWIIFLLNELCTFYYSFRINSLISTRKSNNHLHAWLTFMLWSGSQGIISILVFSYEILFKFE